jgi:hypothetical protein
MEKTKDQKDTTGNENNNQQSPEVKKTEKKFVPNITDALVTTLNQCKNIEEVYFYEIGYSFHKIPEKKALAVISREELLK